MCGLRGLRPSDLGLCLLEERARRARRLAVLSSPLVSVNVAQHAEGGRSSPERADVAQLVERNLAKVEVAGSRPVIRSEGFAAPNGGVAERRGSGLQSRVHGFKSRLHLEY